MCLVKTVDVMWKRIVKSAPYQNLSEFGWITKKLYDDQSCPNLPATPCIFIFLGTTAKTSSTYRIHVESAPMIPSKSDCSSSSFFYYFSPSTRVHVVPFTGGLLLLRKATGAAREPTPRPFTTVGEPIPRTGRHWELNPVPLDLQTNALPTELTGRWLTCNWLTCNRWQLANQFHL